MSANKLVLICEESQTYYSLESYLLQRHGYYPLQVREMELVEEVKRQKPRLVILGITPLGAPLELAIELRADPATRRTSLLVTAIRGHITRDEILRQGANGLLWKPFSPEKLMREVDRRANISPRHRVSFDVKLRKNRPRARQVRGTSVNLSETGIRIWSERPLEVEAPYLLEGNVDRGGFTLDALVVRQASELGPGYYALRFQQAPDLVRQAMATLELAPSD